jgi:hypothetical protein
MTIDKRINYRFGGDTMGGPNDRSRRGPEGPPGGGATSMGSGRDFSNSNNTKSNVSGGGGGGQDPMSVTPIRTVPKTNFTNTSINPDKSFGSYYSSTTINPMDIREQYRLGNISDPNPLGSGPGVTFDAPYMSPALERQRYNNIVDARNLANYDYEKKLVPAYMPGGMLVNTVGNFLGALGHEKNTRFFAENVAGKHGYGYGIEDYQRYMRDRMSGKVGAYGNQNMGQNAINNRASGIMEVEEITPLDNSLTTPYQEDIGENISEDMYFNFRTGAKPLYSDDLE